MTVIQIASLYFHVKFTRGFFKNLIAENFLATYKKYWAKHMKTVQKIL